MVTRAKRPEGVRSTVVVREADALVVLDEQDERAIARDVAAIRAGNFTTAIELRSFLRRK